VVAPSVERMTPSAADRLAYDDSATIGEMASDARRCGARLRGLERAAGRAAGPVPSLRFDDFPREVAKTDIAISDAARRLADALELHLG